MKSTGHRLFSVLPKLICFRHVHSPVRRYPYSTREDGAQSNPDFWTWQASDFGRGRAERGRGFWTLAARILDVEWVTDLGSAYFLSPRDIVVLHSPLLGRSLLSGCCRLLSGSQYWAVMAVRFVVRGLVDLDQRFNR